MADTYPEDLSERNYYDSLLGTGPGDPDGLRVRFIGVDKVIVERKTVDFPLPQREYGDNDPSDPFNNIDEENEL